jgi:hypothetical protein
MADPSPGSTQTATQVPASPPTPTAGSEEGVNLPLLGVLLLILVLVTLSNVWLRRRAESENRATDPDEEAPTGSR